MEVLGSQQESVSDEFWSKGDRLMAARIVVTEFVSLDGVMEAPGGEQGFKYPGWTFEFDRGDDGNQFKLDRKSTRLNSSHANISYAVFCLKKKNKYHDIL